jgi:hypothetical protein
MTCHWTGGTVQVETRFIRIRKQVEPGDEVEGQPVCWVGGWDKARVFYLVMVIVTEADGNHRAANHNRKPVSATTVNHG